MKEAIKDYWEERAKQNATTPEATTNDLYLRELEIATFIQTLLETETSALALTLSVKVLA